MGIDTYAKIDNLDESTKTEVIDKFNCVDLCRGYVYGEIYSYRGGRYNPFLEELKGSKIVLSDEITADEVKDIYNKLCIFVGETLPDYKKFIDIKNKILCTEVSEGINKSELMIKTLGHSYSGVKSRASDNIPVMTIMAHDLSYLRKAVIDRYNPNIERRISNPKTEMETITENLCVVCGGFYKWGKLYKGSISILEIVELMEFYKICVNHNLSLYHTY